MVRIAYMRATFAASEAWTAAEALDHAQGLIDAEMTRAEQESDEVTRPTYISRWS